MRKLVIGILIFIITLKYSNAAIKLDTDIKEFDFIKQFGLNNPQKDADGSIYYELNQTLTRKFKLLEIFNSKKPESVVVDIIFRLELPVNVTFDLFEIHDNSKSEPLKGTVYFSRDSSESESESGLNSDSELYDLSDYDVFNDWYHLTFLYVFEKSKLVIFYGCDPENIYEESFERKGFFESHHRLQYHHLLQVKMGGLEDQTEDVDFKYDIMKLSLYSGSDFSNLNLCQSVFK